MNMEPASWRDVSAGVYPDGPVLTIDPRRQFGDVCIYGSRIPASAVAGCVAAGDSIESVMDGYGIGRDDLLLACWWYRWDCAVIRRKWERAVSDAWSDWAEDALLILGGHRCGPLHDPPDVVLWRAAL